MGTAADTAELGAMCILFAHCAKAIKPGDLVTKEAVDQA